MKDGKRLLMQSVMVSLVLVLTFVLAAPAAWAATPEEIGEALAAGAEYLAGEQAADGSWEQSHRYVGMTGLAVATLAHYAEELGQDPLDPGYAYSGNIEEGLDYIFSPLSDRPIRHNAADERVWWGTTTSETAGDNYVIGPALMAIALSGAPERVVDVAGSAVNGMTYAQVAEEVMNYIDHVQFKSGDPIGSWDYTGFGSKGDQSIAGWVTLGLGYASARFDLPIPPDTLAKLDEGIDIIQWTVTPGGECDGGAGYYSGSTPPYNSWINIYKTGHLLYMMGLVGDTAETPRVQRSLAFLERHWDDPSSGQDGSQGCPTPGWRGDASTPLPSYIATVATTKALILLDIDTVGGVDWYEDFADVIVDNQSPDGSWTQGGYPYGYDPPLPTTWAMLTLLRASPEETPEPMPVGGATAPVNTLSILAPWVALLAVLAGSGLVVGLRHRRAVR